MEELYHVIERKGRLALLKPLTGDRLLVQCEEHRWEFVVPLKKTRIRGNYLFASTLSRLFAVKLTDEELQFLRGWTEKAATE